MKNIIAGVFLFAALVIAYADCSGGVCSDVKINEMQISSDGTVYIQTSGTETALNCTPASGVFIKLNTLADGGKIIFSALLASQAASKSVTVRITDNQSPCQVTYVTVL